MSVAGGEVSQTLSSQSLAARGFAHHVACDAMYPRGLKDRVQISYKYSFLVFGGAQASRTQESREQGIGGETDVARRMHCNICIGSNAIELRACSRHTAHGPARRGAPAHTAAPLTSVPRGAPTQRGAHLLYFKWPPPHPRPIPPPGAWPSLPVQLHLSRARRRRPKRLCAWGRRGVG